MRGTTESMGVVLRTDFDEESAQFRQVAVAHPFTAAQDAAELAGDKPSPVLADAEMAPPCIDGSPAANAADEPARDAVPDGRAIEGLRIVA